MGHLTELCPNSEAQRIQIKNQDVECKNIGGKERRE